MNSVYGNNAAYNYTFSDLYTTEASFEKDYKESGLYDANNKISDNSISLLYYLLYGSHGNDSITSNDPNRWKYKMFSIIFNYGPTWEKQLSLQKSLRDLTDADLKNGSTLIFNHAFNPSTEPTTQTTDELNFINEQNVQKNKRSLLEGYNGLLALLDDSLTDTFIKRFNVLFKSIVEREQPLFYRESEDESWNL